ncbi:MAG: hypothetical protein AB7I33_04160 [Gemmatimonadales bacterium]
MNPPSSSKAPPAFLLLMLLVLVQGLSALHGGGSLILDPSGARLQMSLRLLEGTPFPDYLVPGLVLFVLLGAYPLVILVGLWRRRAWAAAGAAVVGAGLVIWIAVQLLLVGRLSVLQPLFAVLGIMILSLALSPQVRSFCRGTRT